MKRSLHVLFSPAELSILKDQDLSHTVCVVFDVLRATSTMLTAFANGAEAVLPVSEIREALEVRKRDPAVLLAGERDGFRIGGDLTGGIEFDLGNSPREFTADRVKGKTIVMTTTNGTRALLACAHASQVWLGAMLNRQTVADRINREQPDRLMLVCSGTRDQSAFEDVLGAGALCDRIGGTYSEEHLSDAAAMARELYRAAKNDLVSAIYRTQNGRRLAGIPELEPDLALCAQPDTLDCLAARQKDRTIRRSV